MGNNEPQKRQRRWNTEGLKVPEPQSSNLTPVTPKDNFLSGAPKRNFSRSDSTVSEDAKKERVGELSFFLMLDLRYSATFDLIFYILIVLQFLHHQSHQPTPSELIDFCAPLP